MIKLKSLLMEKFDDWKNGKWVHYTDVEYLIPREIESQAFEDPVGIYLFPENAPIGNILKHYWKQKKNKIYVSIASNIKVLDLGKFDNAKLIWKRWKKQFKPKEFTNFLIRHGADAVFDDRGNIMSQEPQLIVLNISKIKIDKIIPNDLK